MSNTRPTRYCFQLQLKEGHIEQYRVAHAAVWPDMLGALRDTGWQNYSIFLRQDGLVIGFFETEDLEATLAGMATREVNGRWQAAMSEHFLDLDLPADQSFSFLTEVFSLDDQLSEL